MGEQCDDGRGTEVATCSVDEHRSLDYTVANLTLITSTTFSKRKIVRRVTNREHEEYLASHAIGAKDINKPAKPLHVL